jgi:hypothetical protein
VRAPEATAVDKQRKGALITGAVLAAMALAIYLTVIVKFFVR